MAGIQHLCLITLLLMVMPAFGDQTSGSAVVRTASPPERGLTEDDFPRVQQISPAVYTFEALTGPPDDRYTTNSMFVVTDDGVLVADGQGNVEDTGRLVVEISKITNQPISHVVICSDHGDHTKGNSAFPDSAEFIAHTNSVAALTTAAETGGVMPDAVIDDRLDLTIGNREIRILFLGRAHTGGDLFVHLPDEKILFTSEVFLNRMFSGYRTSYPREWIDTMNRAEEIDASILIPGHGFIDDAKILAEEWFEYKNHLQVVLDEVTRLHTDGWSVGEAIERAEFGKYAEWSGADSQGPIGIRRIYADLNGELP